MVELLESDSDTEKCLSASTKYGWKEETRLIIWSKHNPWTPKGEYSKDWRALCEIILPLSFQFRISEHFPTNSKQVSSPNVPSHNVE